MIPKEAIEKAIEGGWTVYNGFEFNDSLVFGTERIDKLIDLIHQHPGGTSSHTISLAEVALDPTFWQALGKALGWRTGMKFADTFNRRELLGWEYHAHRFYDLILTGGPTDEFWESVLK